MPRLIRSKVVRQLRGGQTTIPADFRKELGIHEETLLEVILEGRELRIRPLEVASSSSGDWFRQLYELFAPVREEAAARYAEEEVDRFIDEAVQAVPRRHADRGL